MDNLPDELLTMIIDTMESSCLLCIRCISCEWNIKTNKILQQRHWEAARIYGEAIRIHMIRENRACFRFMLRHAISNISSHKRIYPSPISKYSGRISLICAAVTTKGIRCSRKHAQNSLYCWQHNSN